MQEILNIDPKEPESPVERGEDKESNDLGIVQEKSMCKLAAHIRNVFDTNANHRKISGVEDNLKQMLMQVRGEYSEEEKAKQLAKGLPLVFAPITDTKRRAAMAMLGEIFTNPGDKPWTLKPTPLPEVPEVIEAQATFETMKDWLEIVQMTGVVPPEEAVAEYAKSKVDEIRNKNIEWANDCAARMEKRVHDILIEGRWIDAFNEFVDYICTYGTALLKGPVPRVRRRKKIYENKYGNVRYKMENRVVLEFEAISPWDCFPAPNAKNIEDGAFCQRVRFTPEELRLFIKSKDEAVKGWNNDVTLSVLNLFPDGGHKEELPSDAEQRLLENDGVDNIKDCMIEGIEFFGNVKGSYLLEIGKRKTLNGKKIDGDDYYEVDAISVNDCIVFCKIIEPEIGRPLSKGVFYSVPGSWWGDSLVTKCKTSQKACNAALRDLVVNMAYSSGPQFSVNDAHRLHPSCTWENAPWKIWFFQNSPIGQTGNKPIEMFQTVSNANELLQVFEFFKKQADEDTGIPAYTYGTNISAGAGRTASGLAMLTEAATRGIKMVVNSIDINCIRTIISRIVSWLMLYDDDESIKGDVEVNPGGVMSIILKEQEHNRRLAMLQLTQNEIDTQILGYKGRAELLRSVAETTSLNPDKLIPTTEKLEEMEQFAKLKEQIAMQQQVAQGQAAQGQAAQASMESEEGGSPSPQGGSSKPKTPARVRGASTGNSTRISSTPGMAQVNYTMSNPREVAMRGASRAKVE